MRTTLLSLILTLPLLGLACGDKDGDTGGSGWGDGGSTDGGGTDGGSGDGGTDGGSGDGGTDGGSGDGGTDGGSGDGGTDGGSGDGGTDGGSGDGGTEPVNLLANNGFEDGWDGSWAVFPEGLTNYAIVSTGDEIFGSKDTFTAYEGSNSLKVYGQFTGWENETPIYQTFAGETGQTYTLTGWMYQHPDDAIVGTQTYAALAVKFFTADYSGFDMQESVHFTSKSAKGEWVELTAVGEVPKGFTIVQAAVEYWHCFGEAEGDCYDGGAVYVDDLTFSVE